VDYLVGQLYGELDKVLHYYDALLIDSMQRIHGTYTWLDSEWSKGGSTLIRVAWDPGIEGFLCVKLVHGTGMIQWHIWDTGIVCSACLGH